MSGIGNQPRDIILVGNADKADLHFLSVTPIFMTFLVSICDLFTRCIRVLIAIVLSDTPASSKVRQPPSLWIHFPSIRRKIERLAKHL